MLYGVLEQVGTPVCNSGLSCADKVQRIHLCMYKDRCSRSIQRQEILSSRAFSERPNVIGPRFPVNSSASFPSKPSDSHPTSTSHHPLSQS